MRFAAFQPHKRFQYQKPQPYSLDLPVIGGGFLIVIIGIILVSFVWPTLMLDWYELPHINKFVKPEYPEDALLQGINGEVVLRYLVNEDGTIIDPKIIESEPPGVFDEAAIRAVNQWEYDPIKTWGKESVAYVSYRLRFRIPDQSESWLTKRLALGIPEQIVYGLCSSPPEVIKRVLPTSQSDKGKQVFQILSRTLRNECLVTFWVNEEGDVNFPRIEHPYRFNMHNIVFDEIMTAIKQWKFKPALRDGKPITVLVTQRLDLIPKR